MKFIDALAMCMAFGVLCGAMPANAQQSAAKRCLEGMKPVIRNDDGSLSPNPAFDACLRAPIVVQQPTRPAAPPVRAAVPPAGPALGTSAPGVASAVPPAQRIWRAVANAPVESTLRSWLPPDWQLKWDTRSTPRGPDLTVTGDLMTAIKQLASTRRTWSESPGLLQVLVFKADRIVQVRDAPAPQPSVQTEILPGATQ